MQKVNLCKSCAEERGVMDPTSFALADLLFGLGQEEDFPQDGGGEGPATECPRCGLTTEQLKKSGRVGCSHCYKVFSEGLLSIIKAMHKGVSHEGKAPAHLAERRALGERRRSLREQMESAVREERYEDAAKLRDALAKLENEAAKIAKIEEAGKVEENLEVPAQGNLL
jgi:protein arginine kinase activator